jgi:CxxH/CxxC protein (TIGR04129 family)
MNCVMKKLEEEYAVIYCCLEHVELAMDIIVDEHEVAPDLKELSKEEQLSTTCEYCGNNAIYIVAN